MFPQSKSGKFGLLALCALSGVLAGVFAAGPAMATDGSEGDNLAAYEARVVAEDGLVLRIGPSTHYRVVGSKEYGSVVGIVCRVKAERIEGNPVWYKLSDASYVWSSRRDIVRDGEEPRWC
ncbi:hypothetical protein AB0G60_21635 [Streptomyces angustmyceticus]|uniref:SH3b domain-containing protein n=1 Tax=Streptomyces angustmyceticus TaxID=285578 RepID=A0A5J4LIW5_9ACTN|nr:hypothetical protein [Streptomyces angustmyceticus]UAL67110.1 hypothetical protein K7396_11635 [Streptomyces angustmyceticus]GES30608.1 hypothetical protein San01_30950 [Streptomyces angustmyceticus]